MQYIEPLSLGLDPPLPLAGGAIPWLQSIVERDRAHSTERCELVRVSPCIGVDLASAFEIRLADLSRRSIQRKLEGGERLGRGQVLTLSSARRKRLASMAPFGVMATSFERVSPLFCSTVT